MLKKKRLIALLISLVMIFSSTISAFATEVESGVDEGGASIEGGVSNEIDASVWTPEDFTYTSYEKLLYGCDYTRQFTIQGSAISGFSKTGEAKLELNKDLVIPSVDDEGYTIVGVAENAFKGKGLTSVTFPTGMMVDYDDTITNKVTKRGNFIIGDSAFANNELTSVTLPEGVIAVLTYAFSGNKLETVKLPKTIWWIETMSFANNRITTVNFPTACDFQLEMHGMAFAKNFIKSVRLPDYTEVVNKETFAWNTGKEPLPEDAKSSYKTYKIDGVTYDTGVVYMYTDNAELAGKDRIHHIEKETSSQYSCFQKLVINDGTADTENTDLPWNISDFTYEGTTITGLSASGIAKRATNKDLVLPDMNKEGEYFTKIADAKSGGYGLFGAEGEGFDSVYLPNKLKEIGAFAFQNNGLKEVTFPARLETIGQVAFQTNNLTSVILPDTVTSLGSGAFATNPKLERISLSKGLTVIPASAFGCSDGDNWMTNLTSIELHEGITEIGSRAFAGNNFSEIVLPSTVKTIGSYAFSTKNYLTTPCTVTLNEGLETIAADAFRNKVISEITLPTTVTKINKNTFRKEYSNDTEVVVTKVYVSLKSQYEDTKNFPASDYHKIYLTDNTVWTADDFKYALYSTTNNGKALELYPAAEMGKKLTVDPWVVTGFSESGLEKFETNKEVTIPAVDDKGNKVQGIGKNAFNPGSKATAESKITKLTLPENVKVAYDDSTWSTTGQGLTERGDFFIGYGAFRYNDLTELNLPDGVILLDSYAFSNNTNLATVTIPKSVMQILSGAFNTCAIQKVTFADSHDFGLQLDRQAFNANKIETVQLPTNLEKLDKWTFIGNTGKEPVTSGTSAEKKGGVVYIYINGEDQLGDYVTVDSNVHKIIFTEMPEIDKPWNGNNFTYDEAGTTITGLSDSGKEKIKVNPALVLPEVGPTGEAITTLGDGANMKGIFVYEEADSEGTTKYYTPASVKLPSSLTKIGKWTFALNASLTYENNMTSIELPEGLVEIGQTAFQNSKLTSVSIPDSVTTMGQGTFTGSGDLETVKLSKNVKTIPQSAFNAGSVKDMSLKTLVIPEGIEVVDKQAFTGAHIENLTLPNTLTEIGQQAFENHKLTSVSIPGSVTTIGKNAFRVNQEGYTGILTSVELNEGLVTIGQEAFIGNAIEEINLPSTVVLSAQNKAADCIFGKKNAAASPIVVLKVADESKVTAYNTDFANSWSHIVVYDNLVGSGWTLDDFTFDEATGTITGWSESGHAKRATNKELVLPAKTPEGNAVVAVGDEAFKIPDDEVIITKFGVDSPEGMTSIVLPATVTTIGKEAFAQNALTTVDFTNVTAIGESAFYGNDLVSVVLPDTVTSLGMGAFSANDITELTLSAGVTVIPQGAFSMNIRLASVEIPNTVTEIGETAFAGARLTSLTIPESVTKIGKKAFHLHHLTTLTIPGNVKEIGESAFEGTYKATTLKTLVIEEGVEVIGKYAFKEALLETVQFPNSVKTVGEKPFLNNKGKDGSHVVEVVTYNILHEQLEDETYVIRYLGDYAFTDYEDLVELEYASAMYTGDPYEPTVTVYGLTEGEHFKVEYKNNVEVGTATVVLTGLGQYVGTIEKTFVITDNPLVAENEELKAENDKLKAENELLQAENEALKAEVKALKDKLADCDCDKQVVNNNTTSTTNSAADSESDAAVDATVDATEDATTDTNAETATDAVASDKKEDADATTDTEDAVTTGAISESGTDNKFLIGLVIGAIASGCVSFLAFGKRKNNK